MIEVANVVVGSLDPTEFTNGWWVDQLRHSGDFVWTIGVCVMLEVAVYGAIWFRDWAK